MLSRLDFHRLALAGASASLARAQSSSVISGVQLGIQSYSFRDRPLDSMIESIDYGGIFVSGTGTIARILNNTGRTDAATASSVVRGPQCERSMAMPT